MDDKKTVAFQVPADLFEQLKAYLKKHNIKQNSFFLDCIQRALADDAEPGTTETWWNMRVNAAGADFYRSQKNIKMAVNKVI